MEYERIHKTAVISPSKLRMKLLGPSNSPRKRGGGNKSSNTSPSKLEELEFSKTSLLAHDFHEQEQYTNLKDTSRQENNSSNGSSNFEFQREEAPVHHLMPGPFFRQIPSKWNDAEKWIANKHFVHSNPIFSKKGALLQNTQKDEDSNPIFSKKGAVLQNAQNQGANVIISNNSNVRVAPEVNLSGGNKLRGYKKGLPRKKISFVERNSNDTTGPVGVPVSMRDIGTEMTPIASQEQSMAATPLSARSPTFSPLSSIPSTPKRGYPSSSSSEATVDSRLWVQKKVRIELETPEREMQIKTRREIAALGLKLGKFNIASWASSKNDEFVEGPKRDIKNQEGQSVKKMFEARAAVWEESQKSKLVARYKHEEVKIQAWESFQQAKVEAQMNRVEARLEQMKARAQQNAIRKISNTHRKYEGKQAKIEERRNKRTASLAKEVDQIRRTGRAPTSCLRCCSWLSFGLLTK